MKWLGAILFLGVSSWVGFEWSRKFSKRPQHIRQLKNALQILEAEILYSQLPLRDAFLTISKQIPHPTRSFFSVLSEQMKDKDKGLSEIWEAGIHDLMKKSYLGSNEREILGQFGQTLGQHDYTQQQKQIHLTISHLERELQDARDDDYKYGKMAKSLGFLCGLFIVLLLI
ncbi:MAG TPA: stage III sporulation protein SpoIIIAB [Bacillota bacterium]|nr:stage III sporulation protein SpoIIIAB [Bacillota bacterium]